MRLLGPYLVLGRIGAGATAEVLVGVARGAGAVVPHGARVALKRLFPHLAELPGVLPLFLDEARLQSRLADPRMVRVLDLIDDDGVPVVVLELVDGPSLLGLQRVAGDRDRSIPPAVAVHVVAEVAAALHAVHVAHDPQTGAWLRIVHRDVVPANLLVSRTGAVKLTDFGVALSQPARLAGVQRREGTDAGIRRGHQGYLSPEQVRAEELDARADLFSLGVVLAELLLEERLYPADDPLLAAERIAREPPPDLVRLLPQLPARVTSLATALLDKHPQARPSSALEVARELRAALVELGGRGDPAGALDTAELVVGLGIPSIA